MIPHSKFEGNPENGTGGSALLLYARTIMSEWPFQLYLHPLPTHVRPSNGAYVLLILIWIRRDLKPLVSADAPIQQRNNNNGRHDRAPIIEVRRRNW